MEYAAHFYRYLGNNTLIEGVETYCVDGGAGTDTCFAPGSGNDYIYKAADLGTVLSHVAATSLGALAFRHGGNVIALESRRGDLANPRLT